MNTGSETSLVKNYAMLVSLMESYLILEYAENLFSVSIPFAFTSKSRDILELYLTHLYSTVNVATAVPLGPLLQDQIRGAFLKQKHPLRH